MTIFFELAPHDRFHRDLWERNLARWLAAAPTVRRVDSPDDAEFIVETLVRHTFGVRPVFRVAPGSHYRRRPDDTFAWDGQDLPTGRLPGLYCSLPRRINDRRRHRTFCYPYRYNEHVAWAPLDAARHLFGFSGAVTSPLRARLLAGLAPQAQAGRAVLRATESLWGGIFTEASRSEKLRYRDDLQQCKFVLCPRGNGVGTVRLFETLEAGRVPVVISDPFVAPVVAGWSDAVVRVPERRLGDIPRLLESLEPAWPAMAARARELWERTFGDTALLPSLADNLRALRTARRRSERWAGPSFTLRLFPQLALFTLKRWRRELATRSRA